MSPLPKTLTLLAALACLAAGAATASAEPAYRPGTDFVPGQVVVKYERAEQPRTVRVPASTTVPDAIARLRDRPEVDYAVRDYVASVSAWAPNDPGVRPQISGPVGGWADRQWNFRPCGSLCGGPPSDLAQSQGGIDALGAWRNLRRIGRGGAKGVRVAVLDTGVAYRNWKRAFRKSPDFRRKQFLRGWDFVDDDALPLDRNGHGTHVTGTIAGWTNNRVGMTGLAYGAKVIPVRVLNEDGFGPASQVAKGIRYAVDRGARVIGMSFNFPCRAKVPQVAQAARYAHRKGAVLVASTGNAGSETCASPPATLPFVIGVGASTAGGCRADYSLGRDAVDLAAPGGGPPAPGCPSTASPPIYQLTFKARDPRFFSLPSNYEGTSMAAAHVAGAAAMVIASGTAGRKPSPDDVLRRLVETARPPLASPETPAGQQLGAGILDVGRATARASG